MNRQFILIVATMLFTLSLKSQELFLEDLNGDKYADILSISIENVKDMRLKQFYTGSTLWKFTYLNEIYFTGSSNFDSYKIADIDGNGRANLIKFLDEDENLNVWFFEILPNEVKYLGHTLLIGASGSKKYFADINGDSYKELMLVKNQGTNKSIYTYQFINGDFSLVDSCITSGNPRDEYFADITGDGKEDLILSQDSGIEKYVWTFKSIGTTFENLKTTLFSTSAGREMYFMNSNADKDNKVDLVLVEEVADGKKLYLCESDGEKFNYEITNTLSDGINRNILFGDINGDGTDDMIATNIKSDAWSYESVGNVLTYRLHTPVDFTKTIPVDRRVDWENSGYRGGESLPATFNHIIEMPKASENTDINESNLQQALVAAREKIQLYPNEHVLIQFQSGTYKFKNSIDLGYYSNDSYLVLRGKGTVSLPVNGEYTELVFDIISAPSKYAKNFINIRGSQKYPKNIDEAAVIAIYNKESNEITLNKTLDISDGKDWMTELLFTNGKWHYQPNWSSSDPEPDEYTGIISKATLVSGTIYKLENDFNLSWELFKDETNIAKAYKYLPIQEVGLMDFSVRYGDNFNYVEEDSLNSCLINIERAKNCWINNIEVTKSLSAALGIGESQGIEVRNSYFHEAYYYGGGGRGYGVLVGGRSMFCKVENNMFKKFRHATLVQHGSNCNVFGYNYSREQTDGIGNTLGDLNLHGFYPYANLFEGNRVDRIHADSHWGSNGSYNTFFRNYTYYNRLTIDDMEYANIVGNENSPAYGLDKTSFLLESYEYDIYDNLTLKDEYQFLHDTSYYLDEMPSFFGSYIGKNVTWPPIGPGLLGENLLNDIPARRKWFDSIYSNLKSTGSIVDIERLELSKSKDEKYLLYPNPFVSKIYFLDNRTKEIKVYNQVGILVYEGLANVELNLGYLRNGLYFLKINDGVESKTQMVMKIN